MKGFTLLEVLVVVVIISVLTVVGLPQYQRVVERSRVSEAMTNAKSITESQQRYLDAYPNRSPNTRLAIDVALSSAT